MANILVETSTTANANWGNQTCSVGEEVKRKVLCGGLTLFHNHLFSSHFHQASSSFILILCAKLEQNDDFHTTDEEEKKHLVLASFFAHHQSSFSPILSVSSKPVFLFSAPNDSWVLYMFFPSSFVVTAAEYSGRLARTPDSFILFHIACTNFSSSSFVFTSFENAFKLNHFSTSNTQKVRYSFISTSTNEAQRCKQHIARYYYGWNKMHSTSVKCPHTIKFSTKYLSKILKHD